MECSAEIDVTKPVGVREAYGTWSNTYDNCLNPTRDLDQSVTMQQLQNQRFNSILEVLNALGSVSFDSDA